MLLVEEAIMMETSFRNKSITRSTVKLQVGVSFDGAVSQVVLKYQFYNFL